MSRAPLVRRFVFRAGILWKRRRVCRDERGVAAAEFALIAPIFGLIVAGVSDFGGALFIKFNLDGAVSAAANYAILNASSVSSTGAATLATNIASIVAGSHATNWANATVIVNNSSQASVANGTASSGGSSANADSCYCPTLSGSTVTWGTAATCGSTCANGSMAGKFVQIATNRTYNPMFASYGLVGNGAVSASAFIQTQ